MGTYSLSLLTKKLLESGFSLVSKGTLKDLLEIENERTLYRIIDDFVKNKVVIKMERDKYRVAGKGSTFEIANFLYQPSYISLETALNYWGILSQFPFGITSVTVRKTITKEYEDKVYTYNQLSSKYFGMFTKVDGALIAMPEKALFDQLYLVSKGVKTVSAGEYDLTKINRPVFEKTVLQLGVSKKILELYVQLLKNNVN